MHVPSSMLRPGDTAPSFTGTTHDGRTLTLDEFRGKPLLLYFYPKASTAGCAAEAKGFAQNYEAFRTAGIAVVGVSVDTVEAQAQFARDCGLPFPLIADRDKTLARQYRRPRSARVREADDLLRGRGRTDRGDRPRDDARPSRPTGARTIRRGRARAGAARQTVSRPRDHGLAARVRGMKIRSVEPIEVAAPGDERSSPWSSTVVLVKVTTASGAAGWGEAPTTLMTHPVFESVREVARFYEGRDLSDHVGGLREFERFSFYRSRSMEATSALSAVDIACHDLVGRELGVPISNLLGGAIRDSVDAYSNGWSIRLHRADRVRREGHGDGPVRVPGAEVRPVRGPVSDTFTGRARRGGRPGPGGPRGGRRGRRPPHRVSREVLAGRRDPRGAGARPVPPEVHGGAGTSPSSRIRSPSSGESFAPLSPSENASSPPPTSRASSPEAWSTSFNRTSRTREASPTDGRSRPSPRHGAPRWRTTTRSAPCRPRRRSRSTPCCRRSSFRRASRPAGRNGSGPSSGDTRSRTAGSSSRRSPDWGSMWTRPPSTGSGPMRSSRSARSRRGSSPAPGSVVLLGRMHPAHARLGLAPPIAPGPAPRPRGISPPGKESRPLRAGTPDIAARRAASKGSLLARQGGYGAAAHRRAAAVLRRERA